MRDRLVKTSRVCLAALAAAALLAACGSDDETSALGNEEFAQQLEETTQALTQRFQEQLGSVSQALEQAGVNSDQEIPDELRGQVDEATKSLAESQRQAADRIAGLEVSDEVRDSRDQFVSTVREQADQLEQVADREGLTVAELNEATQLPQGVRDSLQGLRDQGLDVQVPELPEGVTVPEGTPGAEDLPEEVPTSPEDVPTP